MREIRLSGLEGGETQSNASSLPLSVARTDGPEDRTTVARTAARRTAPRFRPLRDLDRTTIARTCGGKY